LSDLEEAVAREVADICAGVGVECRMLPALSELLNTDSFTIERSGLQAPAAVAPENVS
jgi:hypothetical protein